MVLIFLSAYMKREMLTLHGFFYLLPLIHGLPNNHNIDNLFNKMSGKYVHIYLPSTDLEPDTEPPRKKIFSSSALYLEGVRIMCVQ